jgi:hypothetical protein
LNHVTIENEDSEEETESEEEDIQNFSNTNDNYVEDPAIQEYTEEEFEVVDEEVGGSTSEDSFVGKYLASIQSRLKGGSMPREYQRKTYWVDIEYEGFDYDVRTSPEFSFGFLIFSQVRKLVV